MQKWTLKSQSQIIRNDPFLRQSQENAQIAACKISVKYSLFSEERWARSVALAWHGRDADRAGDNDPKLFPDQLGEIWSRGGLCAEEGTA